ncbi:LysE family translocator [Roseibium sediminicola]|uniref:LysE family translocator n=1 Tax=Roseibium sediminicola TaxID=2933272 RepID=A0ABT0GNF2_9HYPH|nr:LysE family translocator [Roseibium sp. CAU 1639]MCK7610952.1 LysE family translocator [Roseibium sp. CAU 1639]
MTLEAYLAFIAASLILTMSPGPSILLGMVHALRFGSRKTLFTALGDISANLIQMLLVAIGLGVLIASSVLAFQLLKWGGVLVLVYMSLRMLRGAPGASLETAPVSSSHPARLFLSGFLVAFGNPKALLFFTAFFPQFIDPQADLASQLLVMCPTMAALDFTFVMLYASSARAALGFLRSRPMLLNRISGTALMGAAGILAFAK